MKRLKQTKGITLVALVVTIVILLILAAISIQAITNTGIFTQANNAKRESEIASIKEKIALDIYEKQLEPPLGSITDEQLETILGKYGTVNKEDGKIVGITTEKGYEILLKDIYGGETVAESVPDGAIVNPVNDITTWLKTAGISEQYSYATIEQVIADSTCTQSLMNNENAMKYLSRSTEFADAICASETTMTYLGQSAYVDNTMLNSDTWISEISSSNYWDLIYPSVTVHSSASATITVAGKTFTSDASGNTQHSMPWGTFSVSDSVSGQSFECTIGRDIADVYVMPEGAVYWYGYNKSGTWDTIANPLYTNGSFKAMDIAPFTFETNRIVVNSKNASAESSCLLPTKQKFTSTSMKAYIEYKCSYAPDTSSNYYQDPITMFGKYYQCFQSNYPSNKGLITRIHDSSWNNTQYCTNSNPENLPMICKIQYDNGTCDFTINNQTLSKNIDFNICVGQPLFGLLAQRTGTYNNYGIDYVIIRIDRE